LQDTSPLVQGHQTLFKMMEFILVNMDHKHKKTGIASCYSKKMTSLEYNNQVGLHLAATIIMKWEKNSLSVLSY
jgi:hypothetical protein